MSYEFKREDVPKIIQDIVWYLVTQSEGVENASENLEELGARGYSQFLSQGDYEQKFKSVGYEIIFDILTVIKLDLTEGVVHLAKLKERATYIRRF